MLKSLKLQISLLVILLLAVLLVQYVLSRQTQETFLDGLNRSQETIKRVNLVKQLERNLIDLQRIVLIYKQTGSSTILNRFNIVYDEIKGDLDTLENLLKQDDFALQYNELLFNMRNHLKEYDDNFTLVVQGRERRRTLIEEQLNVGLEGLSQQLKLIESSGLDGNLNKLTVSIQAKSAKLNTLLLSYLLTADPVHMTDVLQEINDIEQDITALPAKFQRLFGDNMTMLATEFQQLKQITRGYLYLVNVVMSGTANEFLYLSHELNALVSDRQAKINESVLSASKEAQAQVEAFSYVSIVLVLTAAAFFVLRIVLPINAVTALFHRLAQGEKVDSFSEIHRSDEIGKLLHAAKVFSQKNQELAEQKTKAEQATLHKSIFLANMSHEIRTPMNGIIGLVDIVLQTQVTPKQQELLEKVNYSSKVLLSIINDILDFSKIEAGELQIENVEFEIHSLFDNLLAICEVKAREKNLNVQLHVNPSLPANLIGDPVRIMQILLNLCTNAIKFTRNGGIKINVDYERLPNKQIKLVLNVIDSGIGMTRQQLNVVFEAFKQADDSTNRKFGGTGLGLSIVKQLSEMMNGSVEVKSQPNVGSHFCATIIIQEKDAQPVLSVSTDQSEKQIVLVCDDDCDAYDDYFLCYGDSLRKVDSTEFLGASVDLNPQSTVCFLISTQDSYKQAQRAIALSQSITKHFGIITHTQPSHLPTLLAQKWHCNVLSHPFTPASFERFIFKLIGIAQPNDLIFNGFSEQQKLTFDGHILIVEDNSINQLVISEMLKNLGLTFDIAEDGAQGVTKIINSSEYDLVLMDIQMPLMDGYEATRMLRQRGYTDLVICGLSANAMHQDIEKAKLAGMNEYLTKPIRKDELVAMLNKYL